MKAAIDNYNERGYVIFSIGISYAKNSKGEWKKNLQFPKGRWIDFTESNTDIKKNGLAMGTGEKNGLIVIDIDDINDWKSFLKDNKQKDIKNIPIAKTTKGLHYYFKYTEDLENVKSNTNCFGKKYSIDIRSNGGCIILPPSSYYNGNTCGTSEYTWINSIFDTSLIEMPEWMKSILMKESRGQRNMLIAQETMDASVELSMDSDEEVEVKSLKTVNKRQEERSEKTLKAMDRKMLKLSSKKKEKREDKTIIERPHINYSKKDFSHEDIECLLNILSVDRINDYTSWINIGMCLHSLNKMYVMMWEKISKKGDSYVKGECEAKWKTFGRSEYKIGSLIYWAQEDNMNEYNKFRDNKNINDLVTAKYPGKSIILGETKVVNENWQYKPIISNNCFIKGAPHKDIENSMYLNIENNLMCIKCKHMECFGKLYPCDHIKLNRQEVTIFNGNVTININKDDEEYVEFQAIDIFENEKVNQLVFNSLNGKSSDIANLLHYYYPDTYVYAEDNNWYSFQNHRWILTGKKCKSLKEKITDLREIYARIIEHYKENNIDSKKIAVIKKIKDSLGDTMTRNNIMTELMDIYSDPLQKFTQLLDSNRHLIGFNNGIYDIQNEFLREGIPEDYVSLTVEYDYKEEYSEEKGNLLQFLHDILPDKDDFEYTLTYISHALYGNTLELFTILTGANGSNGKSKLVELLKKTFGKYFSAISSTLFTRPQPNASQPDPGLLNLSKKRIVIASEPEKGNKLNTGFLKFITGRDSKELRSCHSNEMIDFSPLFLTFLICNDIPDCDDMDNAFCRRLRCINFPTEFVDNPCKPKQRKINTSINNMFDMWKLDFMLILINYYKEYKKIGKLTTTAKILKWTNRYKENTDLYLAFLLERTIQSEKKCEASELYQEFTNWYKVNNPQSKPSARKEFDSGIRKHRKIEKVRIGAKVVWGIKNLEINFGDLID